MAKFFAAELRRRRRLLKLTQEQLAKRAGTSGQTVRNMEAGRFKPALGTARKLAKVLGCRVDDLGEP